MTRMTLKHSFCLLVLLLCAGPLLGQQDLPDRRVGIVGDPYPLSLEESIRLALENNPDIRISRDDRDIRGFELVSRRGVFDPVLEFSTDISSETVPVGSVLAGGEEGTLSTDIQSGSAGIRQTLPFGASWSALFDFQRSTTSNAFNQLDPSYPTFLGVDFSLPLWKNRSIDNNRLQVEIASRNVDLSEAELRRLALDLVTRVRFAYWNLIFAREDIEVRAESVRLAREQLERNERLVNAGQSAEIDVVEAQASLQRRREEWFAGFEELTLREHQLKQLILGDRTADLWSREILPVDRQEKGVVPGVLSEAWILAAERRPEFDSLRARQSIQKANTRFLENQTKPSLDLFASYGMHGLAGSEREGGNPFSASNQILYERVNKLSGFHTLEELIPPISGGVPERLLGGLGQSLDNLFSNDFRTGAIGFRLDVPLGNQTAEGDLAASKIRERQLQTERAALEQAIDAQIRTAMQAVETSQQRLEAARAAREAAQARLESEQRLFQAGETTNFLVLTRQAAFAVTAGSEVRAEMDVNIARAALQGVVGTALDNFGITVAAGTPNP